MNPAPTRPLTGPSATTPPGRLELEHLIDPLVGVIREVVDLDRYPELPGRFHCCIASVADTRQYAVWLADRIAAGTAFGDRRPAWLAAVGEAVERYCGNNIPPDLPIRTVAEVADGDDSALLPDDLPSFSRVQFERPGFPYRPALPDTSLRWVRGIDSEGTACLVPGSWVYLNWHQGVRRSDPRTNHLHYAGIAAGQGVDDARDRALAECVERDSVVAWWTLGLPARPARTDSLPGFAEQWGGCPLEVRLVALPCDFGLPVLGALIWDRRNRFPAAGFAAAETPERASWKAIQEALQVWVASRGLLSVDGASLRAVQAGIFSRNAYLPFRADRRYLDDAGEDFAAIRDLAAQTQLWLDERLHPMLGRFCGTGRPVDVRSLPTGDLSTTRELLRKKGHREVYLDLTTSDVAETGLAVARVLVSGLLVNSPAAYPYLGTPRLSRLARRYRRPEPSPATVTLAPPPHN